MQENADIAVEQLTSLTCNIDALITRKLLVENSQLCDSIRSNNEHFCFFFFAFFFFGGGENPLIFFLFFFFEIFIVTVVFEPFSPQKCVLVQKRHIIVSLSFEVYNEERVQRKVLLLLLLMAEQGPKVGGARSLWNFTPSPGAFLLCCVGVLRVLMIGFLKPILKSQSTSSLSLSLSLSLSMMMMMLMVMMRFKVKKNL